MIIGAVYVPFRGDYPVRDIRIECNPHPQTRSPFHLKESARMSPEGRLPRHAITCDQDVTLRTYLKAGSPDFPSVIASGAAEMTCSAIFRDATLSAPTIASM